ncbi:MAG TPA: NAD(P)/FAD-dependent oxidoreductase [Nitrospirales bacterium]
MRQYDVIIIGAGGAGMMCAIHAGRRGRRVALLEHAQRIGKKILISGGGRCNFTNVHADPSAYLSANPHFCKSALARFTPADFIRMVREHGIAYHEKKLGQLFCDGSAQQIVDMLLVECEKAGAEFHVGTRIDAVRRTDGFVVETSLDTFACRSLVVATGGLSYAKTGATDLGYRLARQFGLGILEPAPALVAITLDGADREVIEGLAGVAADALVSCNGVSFRENILVTHTGLSGPAILQASLDWHQGEAITINLLPDSDLGTWLAAERKAGARAEAKTLLSERVPRRLAERLCERAGIAGPVARLPERQIQDLLQAVQGWTVRPSGTEGFRKAEVTRGGVDTDELSSQTMEAKKIPGLFFIGEVVDVTGRLGGYNFQWAWASGAAAGNAV